MLSLLKKHNIDATKGPILSQFILFALPIAIGGIIQSLFNSADMIVLGNFASSVHVASVGATGVIVGLLVQSCIGLSGGAQVVLSQAFGEGTPERIRKASNTTLWISIIIGLIVTAVAIPLSPALLTATNCPAECFDDAVIYLKIYFASTPAILIYNYGGAIIRSSGDSQRPLYYLIASGALNVVLNFILCFFIPNKVMAVAIATFASQVLGAVLVVLRLIRTDESCKLVFKEFLPDKKMCGSILFLGIPCALNTSLYSISNLQIQSAINSYGSAATAGHASSSNIENFVNCFNGAIGTAVLTFIGQNYGAKKPDRIRGTVIRGLALALLVGGVLGNMCVILGPYALKLFLPDDPSAVDFGMIRLTFLMSIYAVPMAGSVFGNVLNSFGYSSITMANSIITVLGLRLVWMSVVYPNVSTFNNLFLCYQVSWSLSCLVNLIFFLMIYPKKIKKIRLQLSEKTEIAESNFNTT